MGNCTAEASGDDPLGHGHINASIVGGYDGRTGSPFQDPNGYLRGVGVSPYGRMASTKVFDNDGHYDASACDYTDTGVIKHSQDLGAQISTNSWGADVGGDYDDAAQAYDVGVRDADLTQAGNQPLIIFFSAGNAGSGSSTIGSPGTGKNVITVGASENDRPSDEDGDWIDGCGIGPTGADNAMDIFDFSSRGPAEGSRVKPEVVAPGTHIQGTASPQSSYDGSGVCDSYRPSGQTEFAASSGTSHSTPALAGVSSLYYYWLENVYGLTPSPAMMKAYILAHPTYLSGVDANDTLPSNNQGYGMPNMGLAFDNSNRYFLDQTHLFIDTGQTWSDWGVVTNSAQPVRIVLAYTDAPGALGSDPQVNDLNLQVTVGGQTYLGNVFSGQWSTTGGSADANNNYEAVFLPAGVSGELEISVTAANIAGDGVPNNGDATDQDFALVAYNVSAAPAGRLEGYVTQAGTGAPIENALVAASNLTQTVNFSADAAGFYSGLLVTGDYTVTAAAYGYYPVTVAGISVISDAITTQDLALTAVPTFTVSGTVTDANTGWPLYAEINIDGYLGNPLYSDPVTGYYNITLPDGVAYDFDVAPLIAGYLAVTGTVILSGSDVIQNFALDVDGLACAAPGYEMLSVLNEDLENVTFPPAGWAAYNVDGDGSQWARSAARVHSGAASAAHVYSASAQDGWLRTPSIALEATSELRFWENVNYASYYGKHSLWVCTTDCDAPPVNYTEVVEYSSPAEDAWVERMTDLSAYSGQTVYLAFRYEGTDAADWYIDDVLISGGCNPPIGGLVVGNVSDANTGDLLNSARVANAVGDVTTTAAFSGPAGEGFYSLYAPAGSSTMTATLSGYADAIESGVTITAGETVRQDFSLQAGWLHVAPDALHVTVPAGITSTRQLTISNANSAAASSFEIFAMGDSGQIALVVRQDTAAADALQSALTTLEVGFIAVTPDEFRALSVAELLDYEAIFYAGVLDSTASSGTDHTLLVSYLDGGGALYVSDNDLGYYHRDTDPTGFYGTYLQATYVSDDPGIDALVGEDMMAGLNPDISADPYPDDLTVQAEGVRIFQFTGGNAAGVKVARNGYKAIYTSFDFNDIASAADELELVRRVAVFFGMMDVPWLDEAPTTGTVAGGGRVVVDMILDSSVVTETGDYLATLELRDDSPYATIAIPVTMTVVPAYVITPTAGAGGSISPATPQTVMHGSDITFTSASDSGYHINDVWVDGGSVGAMGTYTFENVTADHTISATFAINTYVITPTAGVGGSVTPGTPQTVNYGDDVTFTIAADTGYHINDVWVDGGSVGAMGIYTFENITADHSISATFDQDAYTLSVETVGQGTVTRVPSQTMYLCGDVVTLTATPAAGWYFGQWSGDASGIFTQTTVTMDADKAVMANFVDIDTVYYTLMMHLSGGGVITPAAGVHSYLAGTVVDLSASSATGWQFDGWSGDLESTVNPAQMTIDSDKAITATFTPAQVTTYTLTVDTTGSGSVTRVPSQTTYLRGDVVTLTATPDTGWYFGGWMGDLNTANAVEHLTMDSDKVVTATFAQEPPVTYTLTVRVVGQGTVNPIGGAYVAGTAVTLTATADAGWQFDGWSGAVSGTLTRTQVVMDADKDVTATFSTTQPSHPVYLPLLLRASGGSVR